MTLRLSVDGLGRGNEVRKIEYKRGLGKRKTSTNVEHIFVKYYLYMFLNFEMSVFELVHVVDTSERFG